MYVQFKVESLSTIKVTTFYHLQQIQDPVQSCIQLKTYVTDFVTAFSDQLNRRWGSAWNVFAIYLSDNRNYDTVVYGYGFRNHWMWHNGFKMDDGYYVSFVIWKDYNCNTWFTYNYFGSDNPQNTFSDSSSFSTLIENLRTTVDLNDIWDVAKKYAQLPYTRYKVIPTQVFSSVFLLDKNYILIPILVWAGHYKGLLTLVFFGSVWKSILSSPVPPSLLLLAKVATQALLADFAQQATLGRILLAMTGKEVPSLYKQDDL